MAFLWLINGGDHNYLLSGMILQAPRMPVTNEGLGWDSLPKKWFIILVVTIASWVGG